MSAGPADPPATPPAAAPVASPGDPGAAASSRTTRLVGGLLAGLAVGFFASLMLLTPSRDRFDFLYADFTIESCLASNGVTDLRPHAAQADVTACYNRLIRQGQLNEFQVRRINFYTQHLADQITLWMVVTLTISGVALAAWQIFASSQIVTRNPEALTSELSIESGKIFVRSSVTGLLILMVSFAFFYIYVIKVYQIQEWTDEAAPASAPANSINPATTTPGPALPPADTLPEAVGVTPTLLPEN